MIFFRFWFFKNRLEPNWKRSHEISNTAFAFEFSPSPPPFSTHKHVNENMMEMKNSLPANANAFFQEMTRCLWLDRLKSRSPKNRNLYSVNNGSSSFFSLDSRTLPQMSEARCRSRWEHFPSQRNRHICKITHVSNIFFRRFIFLRKMENLIHCISTQTIYFIPLSILKMQLPQKVSSIWWKTFYTWLNSKWKLFALGHSFILLSMVLRQEQK